MQVNSLNTKLVLAASSSLNHPTDANRDANGSLRIFSAWSMDCLTCSSFPSRVPIPPAEIEPLQASFLTFAY